MQLIPDFKGLGIKVSSKLKPKYMICSIDANSPAYKANLRENDVIVQINRKNIRRSKFKKVAALLRKCASVGHVEILAIDQKGYLFYKNRKKNFSSKKLVKLENTEFFSNDYVQSTQINNSLIDTKIAHDKSRKSIAKILADEAVVKLKALNSSKVSNE